MRSPGPTGGSMLRDSSASAMRRVVASSRANSVIATAVSVQECRRIDSRQFELFELLAEPPCVKVAEIARRFEPVVCCAAERRAAEQEDRYHAALEMHVS